MAGTTGLEPATSDVTGRRSNQLNYVPAARGEFHNNMRRALIATFIHVRTRCRFPQSYNRIMARLALVYGMRLLPADELASLGDAEIQLNNGRKAGVTMHLIEGANENELREQLLRSVDAFFEFYPEL